MNQQITIDAEAKLRVRDALLAQARSALADLDGEAADERSATALSVTPATSDELSQSDEAGDLGGLYEISAAHARAAVEAIEALDFAPTEVVGPGALVGFDGARFVVGVISDEFECDGATYEGISADAPIYQEIDGLKAGAGFTFNGREHRIDFVA